MDHTGGGLPLPLPSTGAFTWCTDWESEPSRSTSGQTANDGYGSISTARRPIALRPVHPNGTQLAPVFALITQAGRNHERQRFAELSEVLPYLVIHGAPTAFSEGEERAFGTILLRDHLPRAIANQLLIEAEYQVTPTFVAAHGLTDLADGSAFNGANHLQFSAVRPDIIHVVPPSGGRRRAISIDGTITPVVDDRFGLKVIDVKISGEASPAHFSELAYYGMTLAGWLDANGLSDRFFVLAEAAIWPGRHDASSI